MGERKVDLLILESLWDEKLVSETSVRPFFDGLSRIDDFKYIYHTFYNKKDLRYFIKESKRQKLACTDYYIAAHGHRNSIQGRKEIIKIEDLKKIFENFRGRGIYFGSCNFGYLENAEEIINYTKAQWVAGFNCPVDWFDSTIIDIIFWHHYYSLDEDKRCPYDIANKIYREYPLSLTLGFSVFDRVKNGKKVNCSLQDFKRDNPAIIKFLEDNKMCT
ncbi:MAG: hypothetical protein Q8M95_06950 [Candidatus Methanoperedens sp.]|nr:hypothetical protein [Candidatus Methanoperedens sp.]